MLHVSRSRGDSGVVVTSIGARLIALLRLAQSELGQDVVEYGLLIATIALVILVGVAAFGNVIRPWFEALAARITTVGT
jgi:Flp pilus assembly pilin Flp